MNFIDILKMEKENLRNTIRLCREQLKKLPAGTLSARGYNDGFYYRRYVDGRQDSITDNLDLIRKLSARHLTEEVLCHASANLVSIENSLKECSAYDPNELIPLLGNAYQNITPEAVEALGFAYTYGFEDHNEAAPMHLEHLKHTDQNGHKRRSKSEIAIAGLYDLLGIPVEYERRLVLLSGDAVYPDFTTYSSLKHVYMYHEHVGNLGDPDTLRRTIWKLDHYTRSELFPFDRVLFTFEDPDGSINMELIKTLIEFVMK